MTFILLITGFIFLIFGANYFVDYSSKLAKSLGISSLIIGLTVVAFGTSLPEASVSIIAALNKNNSIAIGNIVGSNICNLLLILGIGSIICKIEIDKKILKRDFPFALYSNFILLITSIISYINGNLVLYRLSGFIMILSLIYYLFILFKDSKEEKESLFKEKLKLIDIIIIFVSLAFIIYGGRLVVNSSISIANYFNVDENVIALTIVAIGTSLPELITTIIASIKKENSIAIGNVLGSNIFNILFILGLTSSILPIEFSFNSFVDIILLSIFTFIIFIMINSKKKVDKNHGIFMLFIYLIYIFYILKR